MKLEILSSIIEVLQWIYDREDSKFRSTIGRTENKLFVSFEERKIKRDILLSVNVILRIIGIKLTLDYIATDNCDSYFLY